MMLCLHITCLYYNNRSGLKMHAIRVKLVLDPNNLKPHGGIHERFNLKVDYFLKISRQQKKTQITQNAKLINNK